MTSGVLAIIFVLVLFFCISLQRVFYHQSAIELKRRARRGEIGAKKLYQAAVHGDNLRLLLWILIVVSAALAFVFAGEVMSFWPAFILILAAIWLGFVWLPGSKVSQLEIITIGWTAPALAWLLDTLRLPLSWLARAAYHLKPVSFHTGVYERGDLLDLIEEQKHQPDNRIEVRALEMAERALTFGLVKVGDIMIPRRALTTVDANDEVTPGLVNELHKTGQSRFLVHEGKADNIVGSLELTDLIDLKKSGHVKTYFDRKLCYVHEDFDLNQVLDAFHKTHQHMFVVVNKFEDFVGLVTIENVLEAITGEPLASDFDEYHNAKAVAEREAAAEHIAREAAGREPEPDLIAEVIE